MLLSPSNLSSSIYFKYYTRTISTICCMLSFIMFPVAHYVLGLRGLAFGICCCVCLHLPARELSFYRPFALIDPIPGAGVRRLYTLLEPSARERILSTIKSLGTWVFKPNDDLFFSFLTYCWSMSLLRCLLGISEVESLRSLNCLFLAWNVHRMLVLRSERLFSVGRAWIMQYTSIGCASSIVQLSPRSVATFKLKCWSSAIQVARGAISYI